MLINLLSSNLEVINFIYSLKEGRKIPEGQSNSLTENKLTTPWLKTKRTNRQTIVHMTQHSKLKDKQHEPHQNVGVISVAPEG